MKKEHMGRGWGDFHSRPRSQTTTPAATTTTTKGTDGMVCNCSKLLGTNLDIKAVRYRPFPIGYLHDGSMTWDTYMDRFRQFHERDLEMIKTSLGGNTLLLDAWEPIGNHMSFLNKAEEKDMHVIPSFNITYFVTDGHWDKEGTKDRLKQEFLAFMRASSKPPENSSDNFKTHHSVLMWNIVGLPNPEDLLPRSGCVDTSKLTVGISGLKTCFNLNADARWRLPLLRTLQEILYTLRQVQLAFATMISNTKTTVATTTSSGFVFDRPLALTFELTPNIILNAEANHAYLTQFIFWMERVVGCRKDYQGQVLLPKTVSEVQNVCDFNGYGFFDTWIIRAFPKLKEAKTMSDLVVKLFAPPIEIPENSGDTPTFNNTRGAVKPTLFEYGFPAYDANGLNTSFQHEQLNNASKTLNEASKSKTTCLLGSIIDDWTDKTMGTVTQRFEAGSPEHPLRGLTGQVDYFWYHCIDPRYEALTDTKRFKFPQEKRKYYSK